MIVESGNVLEGELEYMDFGFKMVYDWLKWN